MTIYVVTATQYGVDNRYKIPVNRKETRVIGVFKTLEDVEQYVNVESLQTKDFIRGKGSSVEWVYDPHPDAYHFIVEPDYRLHDHVFAEHMYLCVHEFEL